MSETKVISFRVDERHYTMLAERAAAAGQSVGEFSRQLAIEGLLGVQVTATLEQSMKEALGEVRTLRSGIRDLRDDFAVGLKAMLVTAGKVPPEDADAWIESNLGGGDA